LTVSEDPSTELPKVERVISKTVMYGTEIVMRRERTKATPNKITAGEQNLAIVLYSESALESDEVVKLQSL